MSGTLIDTNVLLDIVTKDATWAVRSLHALEAAMVAGPLFINDVIYSELSVRFARIEDVDAVIEEAGLIHVATPRAALFLAGKTFARYRSRGGPRSGVLSDFFVGAHAAVAEMALLTRDLRRFRGYFPHLRIVTP